MPSVFYVCTALFAHLIVRSREQKLFSGSCDDGSAGGGAAAPPGSLAAAAEN